ncbi:hypothetical protein GLP21_12450 [Photobacterium carnosum]|uniref:Conjugal transfer protein TraH n=1 Tax=Photobacterium carnosum TaxID=2023717 RepID=A0A2N4UW84_9GAMM|nr:MULTISPECIES: conjugal transfer protein TraH [Photobacterium]MCD9475877.1 hypothetical protein [Photobacterium phosphoreum]MCD9507739.1 hypothetical protein [Photobacterium phosphoreum]MCD9538139.1 hypothetical protein [Photobacterium carnosum]MCD9542573.1 hypothetical protein [Photobacterium carnosum]MCD9545959.1 hypothetical protein [Photobacterium carnosum]
MKRLKIKNSAISIGLACCITITTTSTAYADNFLEDVFSQMTTVSAPGHSFETQKRNGYAFGMTSLRFHLHEPELIQFTPPSMNVGCGGLDMFGGSFSLIKREELVQVARNVASGAAVYAFNLAIQSICPSCAQIMQGVSKLVSDMNRLAKASCQDVSKVLMEQPFSQNISKNIRDAAGIEGWASNHTSWADQLLPQEGSFLDMLSDNSVRQPDGSSKPNDRGMTGNLIFNLFDAAKIKNWRFVGFKNDSEVKELIMSLVGVRIVDAKNIAANAKSPNVVTIPPTIKNINELVYADGSTPLKLLECVPSSTDCLKFKNNEGTIKANWVGTYPLAKKLLLGSGPGDLGIADKISHKLKLNSTQQTFIESVPVPVMTTLFKLSHNPTAQAQYADIVARTTAQDGINVIIEGIDQMLVDIKAASMGTPQASEDAIKLLEDGQRRLKEQYKIFRDKNIADLDKMNVMTSLTSFLEEKAMTMPQV